MDQKILGENLSKLQRNIGLLSILVIYFFYCYNFSLGIFVKPTMLMDSAIGGFGFNLTQTEQIFAVMSFATIPGTIIFGILSSKIGKKYTLIIIAFLIGLSTALPFIKVDSFELWICSRFFTGLVLGGVFGTAQPLVASMFKVQYRAKLAAVLTSLFSLAMVFAGQMYAFFGDPNWAILMWTAILPPIIGGVIGIFFIPNDYQLQKEQNANAAQSNKKINYLSMYKGKYLYIGILVIILSGINFTGYSAYSNNATTYFTTELGMSAQVAGSIFSLQGIGLWLGYYFWGFISDKFGRKIPLIGMFLSGIIILSIAQLDVQSAQIYYMISFLLGLCFGYSGIWGAYYTELFPQEYSSLSAGISFNGGRIISSVSLPLIASLAVTSGTITTVFYVAFVTMLIGTVVWFLLPETLNK